MNVLQLVPRLEIGGVERGTIDLARYLSLHAHKAVVISDGGKLVKTLDEVGARHYTLPIGSKNPFTMIKMIFRVRDIVLAEDIDIIHARSRVPGIIGFAASRLASKTFITTAHGQYNKHLMSYVMGWGKIVIVASQVMARYMAETFNVRPEKIRIIPRGVDTKKFAYIPPEEKRNKFFTLGMVSRITPLKGHLDFIKAVSVLSRSIPRIKAYIVGDIKNKKSDYIRQMEVLVKSLMLNDVVQFVDQTEDVPSLLSKLDVLVSPSREQEAFGRIIVEAQSSGVPCVATRVGGIVDIIKDGMTGLLAEPSNPHDIAKKVQRFYKEPALAQEIARNARLSVEANYNLEKMMKSTLACYEEAQKEMRILIIKISALGDVILSIPSIKAIRERYPMAVIKVLVGIDSMDALKNLPHIDEIIVCDMKGRDAGLSGLIKLGYRLKCEDFDMVIDFQNNRKSHLLGFLSCAMKRCGYDNGKWSFFLNFKIKDSRKPMDPVSHQMKVLELAGISGIRREITLYSSREDRIWVEKFLRENSIGPEDLLTIIHMESSPRWLTKRWPVDLAAQAADKIAEGSGSKIILSGKNADDEWNQEFLKLCKTKTVSAVGKTNVGRLIALIERCDAVITSDSSPMHIACGVKTPFVALFGPTDPKRHVMAAENCAVISKSVKCAPCYKTLCARSHVCMKSITPDEVFEAVKKLMAKGNKSTNYADINAGHAS